jgi:hypothetical protein
MTKTESGSTGSFGFMEIDIEAFTRFISTVINFSRSQYFPFLNPINSLTLFTFNHQKV